MFALFLTIIRRLCVAIGVAVITGSPVPCEGARRKTPTPEPSPRLAALHSSQVSGIVSSGRGGAGLRYLSVLVTNRGQGEARDIQIYLEAADGLRMLLRGPRRLAGGKRAVFVSTMRFPAEIGVRGRVVTTCSTCRR